MNSFLGSPVFWLTAFLIDRITTFYTCVTLYFQSKAIRGTRSTCWRQSQITWEKSYPPYTWTMQWICQRKWESQHQELSGKYRLCGQSLRGKCSSIYENWQKSNAKKEKSIYELRIQPGHTIDHVYYGKGNQNKRISGFGISTQPSLYNAFN